MTKQNNTIVAWFSALLLAVMTAGTAHAKTAGPLRIDVSDPRTADIQVDPCYPVQKRQSHVLVTVHNTSDQPLNNVTVKVGNVSHKAQPTDVGEQKLQVAANSAKTVRLAWTPAHNGWHKLRIRARMEAMDTPLTVYRTVPVVARQLYLQWYTRNWPEDRLLRWANLVQVLRGDKKTYQYWRGRGVFIYPGAGWRGADTPDRFVKYLAKKSKDYGGIIYDELGGYLDRDQMKSPLIQGFQKFTQRYPDRFTGLYVSGALKPTMANMVRRAPFNHFDNSAPKKKGVDLLLLECYQNYLIAGFNSRRPNAYFDQRIGLARTYDALSNAIMILGFAGVEKPENDSHGRGPYWVTKSSLEDQVRYVRRHAPSMPGIGFYGHPSSRNVINWKEMTQFADSLCLKYFVKPVMTIYDDGIELWPSTPAPNEEVTLKATVYNIGGMDAKNVSVTFYNGSPGQGGHRIGDPHTLAVVSAKQGVPPGRLVVKQPWTASKGYHTIYVVISADVEAVTILDGVAKRAILVQ